MLYVGPEIWSIQCKPKGCKSANIALQFLLEVPGLIECLADAVLQNSIHLAAAVLQDNHRHGNISICGNAPTSTSSLDSSLSACRSPSASWQTSSSSSSRRPTLLAVPCLHWGHSPRWYRFWSCTVHSTSALVSLGEPHG